ncbi:CHAT domain-containing protein [Spirulina subsalsa]|uniref:CHAT domain-containing protein n=1 Tax=Spirulina subsalsa TaxID=54311 RepID=UPI00031BE13F|nr:tetratricopeptide repeat protein [Spirulina subsalsa]
MFETTLRWLQDFFNDLFGSETRIPDPTEIPPLTNEGYKSLFFQLIEGIAKGWQQEQVVEKLGERRYDPWFVAWLQRYGRSALRQPANQLSRELAQHFVRLGETDCGDLGDLAKQIGTRMLELLDRVALSHSLQKNILPTITSDNPVELFNQAASRYVSGELSGAVALWEAALELQPDFADAHNGCGAALFYLGRYRDALAHFNRSLEEQGDFYFAYYNRGHVYLELGEVEEAIADFTQAIEIQPDSHLAYNGRGIALERLQRYQEAIADFNQAITLQPSFPFAYNGRGIAHANLGDYTEALADFREALALDPNSQDAYHNRGNVLRALGRYQEALEDFNQAILIQPNFYQAYYNRANTHYELSQYSEAIADYKEALALKPDYAIAYNGRALTLRKIGRYTDAIADFDQAIEREPELWQAWGNRGWTMYHAPSPLGYEAALRNWDEGLSHLAPDAADSREARGTLLHYKGMAHHQEADRVASRHENRPEDFTPYLEKAIEQYQKALDAFQDQPHLETAYLAVMQDLVITHNQLGNYLNAKNYINIALIMLNQLLLSTQHPPHKIQISRQFIGLHQLKVDHLAVANDPKQHTQALELAEERKNLCIRWYTHPNEAETSLISPKYPQMQQALDEKTSMIYWHLSPAAITTFVLKYQQPLAVLTSHPRQLSRFRQWLSQWQQSYESKRQKNANPAVNQQWRKEITSSLEELADILQLPQLLAQIPPQVSQLILVPHQDLHLLPLHILFYTPFSEQDYTITYLPSAKLAIDLKNRPQTGAENPNQWPLLSVENPTGFMPYADLELAAIAQLFPSHTLPSPEATPENLLQALSTPTYFFHFTGQSYQSVPQERSALILANKEELPLTDWLTLENPSPNFICLSACEAQLKTASPISDDFVGFGATLLTKGTRYVLLSLWRVSEISTTLFMMYFYQRLAEQIPPAQALHKAQNWLRTVSYEELIQLYEKQLNELQEIPPHCLHNLKVASDLVKDKANRQGSNYSPYADPYYWAGFVLIGTME